MAGTLLWNLISGLAAFILTISISLSVNTWETSILHGSASFFIFFFLAFIYRKLWAYVNKESEASYLKRQREESTEQSSNEMTPESVEETTNVIRSLLKDEN